MGDWRNGVSPDSRKQGHRSVIHSCNTADSFRKLIRDDCWQQNVDTRNGDPHQDCPEHLNRALVMEREAMTWEEECNVVPQLHAGGAMAMTAYNRFKNPVIVEFIQADAGIDIGDTFIGMHMKHVTVPVRLSLKEIGEAHVTACRVRPKSIGGIRAVYNDALL